MNRRESLRRFGIAGTGILYSSAFLSALVSCESKYVPGYSPITLSPEEDELLVELTEMIIPTTDTPGAKEAGVSQYIDKVLGLISESQEKQLFLDGLNQLLASGFLSEGSEAQQARLNELSKASELANKADFFRLLKSMTIYGYYTSEIGASQELAYVHTAGTYNGDMPYSEIGKNYY